MNAVTHSPSTIARHVTQHMTRGLEYGHDCRREATAVGRGFGDYCGGGAEHDTDASVAAEQAELDDLLRQAHEHLRALGDVSNGLVPSSSDDGDSPPPPPPGSDPPGFNFTTIVGIVVTAAGALWLLGALF